MNSEHATPPVLPQIDPPQTSPKADLCSEDFDAGYWLRRFVACNPFYLASAALLLFGLYRVSVDPGLFGREVLQLVFNLASLQLYELALVLTAVVLARRLLWYDSNLLLTLENLFVLVPFILISQASLINSGAVWVLCCGAAALAVGRLAAVRRWIKPLNMPTRLLAIGAITLLVNVALPITYRVLHESKVGTKPDWGAAYSVNQYAWMIALPLVFAMINFVRVERGRPGPATNSGWLPLGWTMLWLSATATHLYSLGYVYDFDLKRPWTAPAAWVLSWTLWLRLRDWWPKAEERHGRMAMALPLAAAFLAVQVGTLSTGYVALVLLNICAYGMLFLRRRHGSTPFHLMVLSVVMLVWAVPTQVGQGIVTEFSHGKALALAAAIYGLIWSVCSRNPKLGLIGGVITAVLVGCIVPENRNLAHWAIHAGLGFLVAHSLRWIDESHPGAGATRTLSAVLWAAHGILWIWFGGPALPAMIVPVLVLSGYLIASVLARHWVNLVIPVSAMLILLTAPVHWCGQHASQLPTGLVAIGASFLLFGVGTLAAFTRQRWLR